MATACSNLPSPGRRIPTVAHLGNAELSSTEDRTEAFIQGLRDYGYEDGKNITLIQANSDGSPDRLAELADDLVRRNVDVIVTGGPLATRKAKDATDTIPIVMTLEPDPIGAGFVQSLARPGGNVTGLSSLVPATGSKTLEMLKMIIPTVSRVAIFGTSALPFNSEMFSATTATGRTLGLETQYIDIPAAQGPNDFDVAFQAVVAGRAEAILIQLGPSIIPRRRLILEAAAAHRIPVMSFARDGGLISYGVNIPDLDRRVGVYVDRILKGAKPADLPVELPSKFDFVVNLSSARSLGLTVPQSLLGQASEIIP